MHGGPCERRPVPTVEVPPDRLATLKLVVGRADLGGQAVHPIEPSLRLCRRHAFDRGDEAVLALHLGVVGEQMHDVGRLTGLYERGLQDGGAVVARDDEGEVSGRRGRVDAARPVFARGVGLGTSGEGGG